MWGCDSSNPGLCSTDDILRRLGAVRHHCHRHRRGTASEPRGGVRVGAWVWAARSRLGVLPRRRRLAIPAPPRPLGIHPIHRLFIGNDWIRTVFGGNHWTAIGLKVLVKYVFRQPVNTSDSHGLRCGWSQVRTLPGVQVRPHIDTTPHHPNHRLFIANELR